MAFIILIEIIKFKMKSKRYLMKEQDVKYNRNNMKRMEIMLMLVSLKRYNRCISLL